MYIAGEFEVTCKPYRRLSIAYLQSSNHVSQLNELFRQGLCRTVDPEPLCMAVYLRHFDLVLVILDSKYWLWREGINLVAAQPVETLGTCWKVSHYLSADEMVHVCLNVHAFCTPVPCAYVGILTCLSPIGGF